MTVNVRQLAAEVDTILGTLYDARFSHEMRAMSAAESIRARSSQTREEFRTSRWAKPTYGPWSGTFAEAIAEVEAQPDDYGYGKDTVAMYRFHVAQLEQIGVEANECDAVYRDYLWSRAFLVINSNGHVHSSMQCSTCYDSTRYEWLTHYSGADEDEIVGDAGEMACTVCYPSAPAEVLNRPANIVSKTRAEKDAAKAQRQAEKDERAAKKLAKAATIDGSTLRIPDDYWPDRDERIDTEYAARREWNSDQDSITSRYYAVDPSRHTLLARRQSLIEEALSVKYGITPTQMREQLLAKYAKRRKD
jgi:hypothetical protein